MADSVRAAEEQYLNGGPEFWEAEVSQLLARVDNIERNMLGRPQTRLTCYSRRLGMKALDMARGNRYLRHELGIPDSLFDNA